MHRGPTEKVLGNGIFSRIIRSRETSYTVLNNIRNRTCQDIFSEKNKRVNQNTGMVFEK
jgi:hypothetical protein